MLNGGNTCSMFVSSFLIHNPQSHCSLHECHQIHLYLPSLCQLFESSLHLHPHFHLFHCLFMSHRVWIKAILSARTVIAWCAWKMLLVAAHVSEVHCLPCDLHWHLMMSTNSCGAGTPQSTAGTGMSFGMTHPEYMMSADSSGEDCWSVVSYSITCR